MSRSSRHLISPYKKITICNNSQKQIRNKQRFNHHSLFQIGIQHYHHNQISKAIHCLSSLSLHQSIEAQYILGVCYLKQGKYQIAESYLKMVLKQSPKFKDNIYLLVSICEGKKQCYQAAIKEVSKGIEDKNQYLIQMLVYRAKMYTKIGKYKLALKDLKQAKMLNRKCKVEKLLIECCRILGQEEECLKVVQDMIKQYYQNNKVQQESETLSKEITKNIVITPLTSFTPNLSKKQMFKFQQHKLLSIKIHCLVTFNKLSQASQILPKLRYLNNEEQSSIYYYLRGLIQFKQNLKQQCILSWNQSLNLSNNQKAVRSSIEQLSIFYMKNRDFYEAYQYLLRAQYLCAQKKQILDVTPKTIYRRKSFNTTNYPKQNKVKPCSNGALMKLSEGIIYLMKRKIEEATNLLASIDVSLLSRFPQHYHFLYNLYYSCLGFGYFCKGEHEKALQTYQMVRIKETSPIDSDSNEAHEWNQCNYNINLCKGILQSQQSSIEAINYFEKAKQYIFRAQPYFYVAVVLICRNLSQGIMSTDVLIHALEILDKGLSIGENSHMYYYRGVIHVALGMNNQALQDVDQAIQKSQDNVAKYFFLRGVIFMLDKNYEQAVVELSTCLSVDENFKDAYLERGKCLIMNGQNQTTALMDIYEHPDSAYWKNVINLYRRDFEEVIEKCEDDSLKEIAYFHLGKYENAGAAGKLVLSVLSNSNQSIIELLDQALEINLSIGCMDIDDIMILKCYHLYRKQQFTQCQQLLVKVEEFLRSNQKTNEYIEQYEKRLLMVKINRIIIKIKLDLICQALQMLKALSNQVYQGEVHEQIQNLISILQSPNQEPQHKFKINFFQNMMTISDSFPYQQSHRVLMRFNIPFPKLKFPQLEIPNYQKLLTQFNIKSIENNPQAPWIRRGQFGVLFTNEVQNFELLQLNTEENQTLNRNRIKQSLQLGSQVLNKLNKIVGKEKPQQRNNTQNQQQIQYMQK